MNFLFKRPRSSPLDGVFPTIAIAIRIIIVISTNIDLIKDIFSIQGSGTYAGYVGIPAFGIVLVLVFNLSE